jgi:hypothetical protein
MRPHWKKPVKHADAFTEGVADLSAWIAPAGNIWIECKTLARWPVRPFTRVRLGLEPLQVDFLRERRGWLWVRVGREYLLFDHSVMCIAGFADGMTQGALRMQTVQIWKNSVNWQEFATWVRERKS